MALGMFTLSSCEDALDVDPTTEIPGETAVNDLTSLERAAYGAYSALQPTDYYGLRYLVYQDVYADNLAHAGTFSTDREVSNRNINQSNLQIAETWASIYLVINRANTVIEQANELVANDVVAQEDADLILGQMYFLRGLAYFDLVKVFGGVPLELTAVRDLTDIDFKARSSQEEVYQSIISDLQQAEALLPPETGTPTTASGLAASALLARVYLQQGNNAQAAAKATEVIESGQYNLVSDFEDVFLLESNNEIIFSIEYTTNDQNGLGSATNLSTPGQKFVVRQDLFDALQESGARGDERFAATAQAVGQGNLKLLKYEDDVNNSDDVIVLRLAEMYLIRAEALARQGTLTGLAAPQVLSDINQIRTRAGLSRLLTLTNSAALNEILEQRRLEFVGEGLRFMDLKRYNRTCEEIGFCEATGAAYRNLWPIPLQELELNPSLVKNPGY
ncbi:membrane protein [Pontibacter akesuensis]|nr:membrane protein [Pontibacter akesuensis]